MKLLNILAIFYILNVVLVFYIYYFGMDEYYPKTMLAVKNFIGDSSAEGEDLANKDKSAFDIILDIVGKIQFMFMTTFGAIIFAPSILATFIEETIVMLNVPYTPIISQIITVSWVVVEVYFVKVIMEWLRPGSTQNI